MRSNSFLNRRKIGESIVCTETANILAALPGTSESCPAIRLHAVIDGLHGISITLCIIRLLAGMAGADMDRPDDPASVPEFIKESPSYDANPPGGGKYHSSWYIRQIQTGPGEEHRNKFLPGQ